MVTENVVKRALAAGEVQVGTMVSEFLTANVPRLVASAGADFVVYDLEHSGLALERLRGLLPATSATGVAAFVRVPDTVYDVVARALDVGAQGIMIPTCDSAEQARALVRFARFPPEGRRGFGLFYRDAWDPGGLPDTLAEINAQTLLIAQIETAAGLEAVEEIAAVDGLDVLWIGLFDLAASLGVAGRLDADVVSDAIDRIVSAARAQGKAVAILCADLDEARAMLARGVTMVAYGLDVWLFEAALRAGVAAVRELR